MVILRLRLELVPPLLRVGPVCVSDATDGGSVIIEPFVAELSDFEVGGVDALIIDQGFFVFKMHVM